MTGVFASTSLITSLFLLLVAPHAIAKDPDCTSPNAWPAGIAYTHLKNSGSIQATEIDTTKTSVSRLASEKVGKRTYRQVHLIRFATFSGERIEAITVNEVSRQECSMSGVDVFLISRRFGDYGFQK